MFSFFGMLDVLRNRLFFDFFIFLLGEADMSGVDEPIALPKSRFSDGLAVLLRFKLSRKNVSILTLLWLKYPNLDLPRPSKVEFAL